MTSSTTPVTQTNQTLSPKEKAKLRAQVQKNYHRQLQQDIKNLAQIQKKIDSLAQDLKYRQTHTS